MPTEALIAGATDLTALGVVHRTAKFARGDTTRRKKKPSKKAVKKHYGGLADAIVNGRL